MRIILLLGQTIKIYLNINKHTKKFLNNLDKKFVQCDLTNPGNNCHYDSYVSKAFEKSTFGDGENLISVSDISTENYMDRIYCAPDI